MGRCVAKTRRPKSRDRAATGRAPFHQAAAILYLGATLPSYAAVPRRSEPLPMTLCDDALTPWLMALPPGDGPPDDDGDLGIAVDTRPKTQRPPLYKVLLLNDDFTPMEFVVHILERLFSMTHAQAIEIMLTVHRKGLAVVGVFSHEIAETKVMQVMELARRQQHPLQCTMEKE